jgi:hypothetical protein
MQGDGGPREVTRIFRGMGVHPDWPERLKQAQRQTTVSIGGVSLPRIRYGDEGRGWQPARRPCGDCAAIKGEFHVPGCDLERCPSCQGQAISCGCRYDEIK